MAPKISGLENMAIAVMSNFTQLIHWKNHSLPISDPFSASLLENATLAEQPFRGSKADAAILTSNGVLFPIVKASLSCISPLFEDLFANRTGYSPIFAHKQLSPELDVGIPVFWIAEESSTFKNVLEYVYPGLSPPSPTLEELVRVANAMKTYCMEDTPAFQVGVIGRLYALGTECPFPGNLRDRLTVFLLLYRYKRLTPHILHGRMVTDVAKTLLLFPRDNLALCDIPDLDSESPISARAFIALLRYHQQCQNAISTHLPSYKAWPPGSSQLKYRCSSLRPKTETTISRANIDQIFYYLRNSSEYKDTLYMLSQRRSIDIDSAFGNKGKPVRCSRCRMTGCSGMVKRVKEIVANEVKSAVEGIELELPDVDLDDD